MADHLPDYHHHEDFRMRSAKLADIRALGIDPYPAKFVPTTTARALSDKYETQEVGHSDDAAGGCTPHVFIAGRLVLFRSMGKNAFAHIQDESGRIQVMFNRDLSKVTDLSPNERSPNGLSPNERSPSGLGPDAEKELSDLKFIEKKLDLGDIIGIEGHLFRTQKGELTIFAKTLTLLCKTLLPLPDKHSGLVDKGVRYRKRWLDLISHSDVATTFRKRSHIVRFLRRFFEERGFLEVETPVLQNVYGGAQARPFATKLNALDQEMFLRISLEIPLKKLIVGGMDRVFEISKVFRNEGIDRTHNPEFTELEAYAAYWDYNDMMKLTEELFEGVCIDLYGSTQLPVFSEKEGKEIVLEMKTPWKRLSMKDSIKQYGHLDVDLLSEEEMRKILQQQKGADPKELQKAGKGALIALLFEEFVEEHLIQPHHIIDHPIETTPLCKLHRDPALRKERIVERFETFIVGREFCNSYTELNDPELQRKLLVEQAQKKLAGDEEANPLDEEFIEAVCQGMPPASGLGIGVDRLVMLFTGMQSIRDVLYFPLMRPEES